MSRLPVSLQVSSEARAPSGCGLSVLDDSITVCLMLKGLLDPVKEAAKLKIKLVCQNAAHPLALGL